MAKSRNVTVDISGILGLIFITLKLTGYINWSWWWVTAPFWATPVFILTFFLVVIVGGGATALIIKLLERSARLRAAKRAIG